MKFTTTSAALAVAATGAAAQDGWSSWASGTSTTTKPVDATKTCPATITAYKTTTATAYEATSEVFKETVTIPIPAQPASVDVKPVWADWESTSSSSAGPTYTKAPDGCHGGKTVTSTTTVTTTKSGTTTVTHSTLFVGAQVTGSADEAWDNWNPDKGDSSSGSGSGNSNGNGWNGNGANNGNGDNNGNGWNGNGAGNGNGNGNNGWNNGNGGNGDNGNNGWNGNNGDNNGGKGGWNIGGDVDNGLNGKNGWGKGSWGGKGTGGLTLGEGNDVFHWDPPVATETKSGSAPQYTKNPDGTYGGTPWGDGSWTDWNGNSGSGNGDDSGSGNGNGNGNGDGSTGGGKNNTTGGNGGNSGSVKNGTFPDFGSPSSNLTKPHLPLQDSNCNSASDRSKWCGGKSTSDDYYEDYFTNNRCTFDLTITNGTWNQDGTDVMTFLINGQYPGPAIECNWGDMVIINVHNQLENNGTAIHWHGVRQHGSNDQDGVPGVTECAIAPGQSRTYTWRASSYGTSWYHSHWGLQYGDGIQGPIIIHGPATANYDVDAGPVMISDTYGMTATQFGSLIAHIGPKATDNYLLNGKNVKADLSSGQHPLWQVQKGKKYLFRLINSAAQNMYAVSIDQHKLKVIAADFVPIVPYETEWLNIGIGQRYDVVVEMNQDVGSYHFRAVTQTLCPAGSINSGLGSANGIIAYDGVSVNPLLLPTSTLNGNKTAADFNTCQDEPLASLVPFLQKTAGTKSSFTATSSILPGGSVSLVNTTDDGAVFRWLLNSGAMYINYTQPTLLSLDQGHSLNDSIYANPIVLKQQNQWVYFVIQNQFFAFHPMHLHGHDFSVLGQGDGEFTSSMVDTLNFANPIRRDTAMLKGSQATGAPQGGYTVIGFETDNPGAWLMHCHIAWHVDQGLALQWIERPDDMTTSGPNSRSQFGDECKSYAAYEAQGTQYSKFSGQSGLRRRGNTYFDKMVLEASRSSVVRREEGAAHYLSEHMKRGLGDGGRRSFGRRR